ncbi:MAG TPA: homoserine dehydrogenase [Rhodospirillaceae bacterium]|nr:homoserine dehydrogenase [Rhodospirillaceae bacterium]HAA93039.1 homoserine dehydrogenase [Rhodospirillaceae bacterium]HAT36392.1 homoserine dehydrogenase [Rhodospirillaceae bacterium]
MTEPLKIAIAGLGTVGAGSLRILQTHGDLLAERARRPVQVTAVSARDKSRDRGLDLADIEWYEDAAEMAAKADCDLVLELIGGSDGIAKTVCEGAIAAGRHVVTANKALIALHGTELAKSAEKSGVSLAYEAAVAGGIPVVKALREGLTGNRVTRIQGILNGTCNYILTAMRESARAFDDVLAEAQELGYAEADPSFDIDGIDAAHKLAILSSLAFGSEVDFDGVHVEGIRSITEDDIAFADELGYRIKLLGIAECTDDGIRQRVHPTMVPISAPIAAIEGVLNGVAIEGDFVGPTMLEGAGAGGGPTASAVVADIVDIACGRISPVFGIPADSLESLPAAPMESHAGPYFVRMMVYDRPGVLADISATLRDHEISIEGVIQRTRSETEAVPVVLTVHETTERAMNAAMKKIAALDAIQAPMQVIRIERS